MLALPRRVGLALVVVFSAVLASSGFTAVQTLRALGEAPEVDPITTTDRQLAQLRTALGSNLRVSYLGPERNLRPEKVGATMGYQMMRYALAPVLIYADASQPLVVAHLGAGATVPSGYAVVQDFGDGLYLLRPSPP